MAIWKTVSFLCAFGFAVACLLPSGPAAAQTLYTYSQCKDATYDSDAADDECSIGLSSPSEQAPGPSCTAEYSCLCTAGASVVSGATTSAGPDTTPASQRASYTKTGTPTEIEAVDVCLNEDSRGMFVNR